MDNKYGLSFPIIMDSGRPLSPNIGDSIDSSIKIILTWLYGSRFFTAPFGSIIPRILGQPISSHTIQSLEVYTLTALSKWEPRLLIKSIDIDLDYDEGNVTLLISAIIRDISKKYFYQIKL